MRTRALDQTHFAVSPTLNPSHTMIFLQADKPAHIANDRNSSSIIAVDGLLGTGDVVTTTVSRSRSSVVPPAGVPPLSCASSEAMLNCSREAHPPTHTGGLFSEVCAQATCEVKLWPVQSRRRGLVSWVCQGGVGAPVTCAC